jgi:hypothetical protein
MPRIRSFVERMAQVETEARKLARSGLHENYRSIEMTLLMHGYREALKICANPWTQSELDRLCSQARPASNSAAHRVARADAGDLVAHEVD